MSRFRVLAENFFNVHQFGAHVITASTYQSGNEPWRVATGRRSPRNAWIAPTTGAQTIRVTCDQVRAADMLALDRGHNLVSVDVQFTNSTANGWSTYKSITLPTASYPNQKLTEGARTPEGAYVIRFATSTALPVALNWRLSCATTAGGNVKVVGAYLGLSFSPEKGGLRPWDDETIQMQRAEVASPELWTAAARVADRRTGTLTTRLTDIEGEQARYHFVSRYWKGELSWVVPDENDAGKAVLANSPSGSNGLPYPNDWPTRVLSFAWEEHQPKPR